MTSRRKISGFSLVEVLVAMTIFALAAIILGSSYVNVLNSYAVASRTAASSEDLAYARSLVLTEPDITKLDQGGEFDTASGRHAKWSVEITPTTTADLFTVAFTCEFTAANSGDPEKISETFMLLRPTWSIDPAARSQLRQDAKTRILEMQGQIAGSSGATSPTPAAGRTKL